MASKELNVKIKQRYDTASNWTTNNPVLLAGEFGIESDTKKIKIGDGTTDWISLNYAIDLKNKMDKENPTGTGSFSLNRQPISSIGQYSTAEGINGTASGLASHAEGNQTFATGAFSHTEGNLSVSTGRAGHAEGDQTRANGDYSHTEGKRTFAKSRSQHIFGEYNIVDETGSYDSRGAYVEIVGNGDADENLSNARTLDWDGNEWIAGNLQANEIYQKDASGNYIQVANKEDIPTTVAELTDSGDYVTTNTDQKISGEKKFEAADDIFIYFSNVITKTDVSNFFAVDPAIRIDMNNGLEKRYQIFQNKSGKIALLDDIILTNAVVLDDTLYIAKKDGSTLEFKGGGGTKIIWEVWE